MRCHLRGDLFRILGRGIVGRPVDKLLQYGRAIRAPVEVKVLGIGRRDLMITELDEAGRRRVSFGLAEDVANAAVALRVGQDRVTVAGIARREQLAGLVEGDAVARDGDAIDVGPVSRFIRGAIVGGGLVLCRHRFQGVWKWGASPGRPHGPRADDRQLLHLLGISPSVASRSNRSKNASSVA